MLLIGSGGREHALAWKLASSPSLAELHAAPGNPGIAALGTCHPVAPEDSEALLDLARSIDADLVVIGPETPLVAGVADHLRHAGVSVFGPSKAAARIEGSKTFAKDVMSAAGVPTPAVLSAPRAPCVLKADGLAAGKGVFVCENDTEVGEALSALAASGAEVFAEELVQGDELSLLALADGERVLALAPARDYKRVADGDDGPNTGGMGSFSPVPGIGPGDVDEIVATVHRPVLAELAERGAPFIGCLYAGLMLMEDGIRVLEFNCRFGDPETQSILPRLEGDLLEALAAAAGGDLSQGRLSQADDAAVTVVLAAKDYPAGRSAGAPIGGIEDAEATGALVFHAGTATRNAEVVTNGGRVLNVTALGPDLAAARRGAYEAARLISFGGARYRHDIAEGAVSVAT